MPAVKVTRESIAVLRERQEALRRTVLSAPEGRQRVEVHFGTVFDILTDMSVLLTQVVGILDTMNKEGE